MKITQSINGALIRLPDERWAHIIEEHPEVESYMDSIQEVIAKPDAIYEGNNNELLAVKEFEPGKQIIVVYKEIAADGFIITAFFSRNTRFLEKRKKIWEQQM